MNSFKSLGRWIVYIIFFGCTYALNLIIIGVIGSLFNDGENEVAGAVYGIVMLLVPPILSTLQTVAFSRRWALKRNEKNHSTAKYIEPSIEPALSSCTQEILSSSAPSVNILNQKLLSVDLLDGHAFEYWCAAFLREIGFIKVEVTPGSGDQGVDILAEKDGIKYAIQCKCYASNLGNTPIQEVTAGKSFYHCHVGVVMTNRYFTPKARELAEATGTLLWDRDWIAAHLKSAES